MKCGLLGRTLGHSYSPYIHAHLGNYSYELIEREPDELEEFLKDSDFAGFNVTIPYKKVIIPYLQELSPIARKLGAVNTVVRRSDGTLYGHNTDYYGFYSMIVKSGFHMTGKKVLVLGSGGASNTAVSVLQEMGADVTVISRSGKNNYSNLHLHRDAAFLINTTPVGMYPNTLISPVRLEDFPGLEGVADVIYNPSKTKLILDAQRLGIPVINGLWMLVAQAKEASELFTASKLPDDLLSSIHAKLSCDMENIILVGMPGCGKTTIGKYLSQQLGKEFIDADICVSEYAGKSIPEIFAQDGESAFRAMETEVLRGIAKSSGKIIATGGGCITRDENLDILRQNGKIIWLKRDLDKLPTDGRPLSLANKVYDLYQQRRDRYEMFSDVAIDNNGKPEDTAHSILQFLEGSL